MLPSVREMSGEMMTWLAHHSCDVLRLIISGFSLQRLKDEIAEVTSEIENLGSTEER